MNTLSATIRKTRKALRNNAITINEWWSFIADVKANGGASVLEAAVKNGIEAEHRLMNYKNSPLFLNKVRPYCNHHLYTDVHAYEVVRVISSKCVEVRRMDAEMTNKMTFVVGGFAANCPTNDMQEYKYTSNVNNEVIRVRLGKNGWKNAHGGKHYMSNTPYEKYDFNF